MKDTYFIQYYDKDPWFILDGKTTPKFSFNNGFSQTYKILKNRGEFIWLESGDDIPIDRGNLFISLQYKEDGLDKIIQTAKDNPHLNITLGGPYFFVKRNIDVPDNITLLQQITMEEYLGVKFNPDNWGLELPPGFHNIGYNFSLIEGHGCYWGECTFCKWGNQRNNYKILPIKNVPIIDYEGPKIISLRSSSLTPKMMKLFTTFPARDDVFYNAYIRGDEQGYKNFLKILPKMKTNNVIISLGVEIPSNEMLKNIKKGTTKEMILKTLKLLNDYGLRIHLSFMLGWNNLSKDIVNEVKDWMYELDRSVDIKKISVLLYRLMIVKGRPIYDNPPGFIKERPDGMFECILDDNQWYMNESIRKLYHKFFNDRLVDFYNRKDDLTTLKRTWKEKV